MRKRVKEIIIYSLVTILFLVAIIILINISNEVVLTSFRSVKSVCKPQEALQEGIQQIATTTLYTNGTIAVKYFVPQTPRLTKHEQCHVTQIQRKYKLSAQCEHPVQKFFTEVECNLVEYLPTPIYEKFYGKLN